MTQYRIGLLEDEEEDAQNKNNRAEAAEMNQYLQCPLAQDSPRRPRGLPDCEALPNRFGCSQCVHCAVPSPQFEERVRGGGRLSQRAPQIYQAGALNASRPLGRAL